MLGRLLLGIVKGLVVGGLVGALVAKLGFAAPGAIVAYASAAVVGVLVGLVAGKPIWAKDARIEAGMKAFVGALLAAGLMYAARRWVTVPLPVQLGELGGANASLGEALGTHGTLGGLAVTSLAMIAALLGGFYEADNTPDGASQEKDEAGTSASRTSSGKRIAAGDDAADLDDELDGEPDKKRVKK